MASRILKTSKDTLEQQQDLEKLKTMLVTSEYPRHEIDRQIKRAMQTNCNLINTNKQEKEEKEMKYTVSLPYVQGIEVLKRRLARLNIRTYFSYTKKIQSLCTSTMKTQSNSIIYQIPYDCGKVYNGETKLGLSVRMSQHKKIIEKDEKESYSEMVKHHQTRRYQCMSDPTKAFVIDSEIEWEKRKTKEVIYSIVNDSINRHDELDQFWTPLLYDFTSQIKKTINSKNESFGRNKLTTVQGGDSGSADE